MLKTMNHFFLRSSKETNGVRRCFRHVFTSHFDTFRALIPEKVRYGENVQLYLTYIGWTM